MMPGILVPALRVLTKEAFSSVAIPKFVGYRLPSLAALTSIENTIVSTYELVTLTIHRL